MIRLDLRTPSLPRTPDSLRELVTRLRQAPGFESKREIQLAASFFGDRPSIAPECQNGDDAAAIPDGEGYLLLAAEGMTSRFVQSDPWFAGYSAVMVNVSDIAAMGGRSLAIVNVLYQGRGAEGRVLFDGMRAASEAFGVPVVGGHTGRSEGNSILTAAIVGRARRLISSFQARPGDALMYVVDLRGTYRGRLNFNAATHAAPQRLRRAVELLPAAAEAGLVHAGKDVSMAGLLGTLAMLCESSGAGATVELDRIPRPLEVHEERWLLSFPSYGYLLCVNPGDVQKVQAHFGAEELSAARIGTIDASSKIEVVRGDTHEEFWSRHTPYTGFGGSASSGSRV
jgi:uncharacterized protein